jgi:hypothetical protein
MKRDHESYSCHLQPVKETAGGVLELQKVDPVGFHPSFHLNKIIATVISTCGQRVLLEHEHTFENSADEGKIITS